MADTTNKKKLEDYGSFNYADYTEGDAVTQARDKLNSVQNPGDYKSNYEDMIKSVQDKILNRDKFSYDLNGDALYQQYKNQYINQGQMAMMDTIGQASAMTGGYGNSYAQNVGQQAYQGYLQQLNNKVPELYQLALDQYNREGDDLYNQYGLLSDREATEYGRHRDTVSDYQTDRGFYSDQLNAEREFDYSKYADNRDFSYNKFSDDRNLGYQLDSDAVKDAQWQAGFDEDVRQFDENMAFDKEQFDTQNQQWQAGFDEDVRQFDENMSFNKEQAEIQKQQWQAEFDQRVYEVNENLKLDIRRIEEDERNGKISREVAQREIALKEEEAKRVAEEAQKDLEYKYAALQASTTGSYNDPNGNEVTGSESTEDGGSGTTSYKSPNKNIALEGLAASLKGDSALEAFYNKYPEYDLESINSFIDQSEWALDDNGGANGFLGLGKVLGNIDDNGSVSTPFGVIKMKDLYNTLVSKGVSKDAAKKYVVNIQKTYGI